MKTSRAIYWIRLVTSSPWLNGSIPQSISRLVNLETWSLNDNYLSGRVEFELFLRLRKLDALQLSRNDISLLTNPSTNSTFPKFTKLLLADCDLGEFPEFLRNQDQLELLDLSGNKIHGQVPKWMGNVSTETLWRLYLQDNFLICFDQLPIVFPYVNLKELRLDSNMIQGSVPIPPPSIDFCKGRVPRSLADCTKLEAVSLGTNQIHDIFPSWLGILPKLRILILRCNELYGTIGSSDNNFDFLKLHIIDLSNNDFTGKLPSEHFQNWKAMQIVDAESLKYVKEYQTLAMPSDNMSCTYSFSMTMINKGTETLYERVNDLLIAIDLSNNRFEGEIPDVVGNLKGLHLLNFSSNFLTGPIPFTLANLTRLEALDLSQNKLSGAIPLQLTELTFLSHYNVSYNRLTGPIPHGKQFDTFNISLFSGNPELYGSPLSKKCGNPADSLPPSSSHNSEFSFEFG
ncbi:receptor-like protein 19 [Juglans microcarpa x Juglans regia]|uniref:receptor-like protein 19 n=1 Tax=Juglans microcarpa x Juglans regia TaxID=2249226 RepID=UPI001B7E6823|nr:receptor-like protein 19 [Juglans microcarpa x Juglans regia]